VILREDVFGQERFPVVTMVMSVVVSVVVCVVMSMTGRSGLIAVRHD